MTREELKGLLRPILLNETLTNEARSHAMAALAALWLLELPERNLDRLFNDWNLVAAELVDEHGLSRN